MVGQPALDATGLAVIDQMYGAALDPERWGGVLEALAKLFRADEATLELHDTAAGDVLFFDSVRADVQAFNDYVAHFASVNPRIPGIAEVPEGAFFCDHDFYSEADISRSEFYEDFLAPQRLKYVLSAVLVRDDRRLGVVAIHRSAQSGHADTDEADMMRALTPHLKRALELTTRLDLAKRVNRGLCDAIDSLALPVVLFDARSRVRFVNEAAQRMFHSSSRLAVRDRELHARLPEDDRVLREAIRAAANGFAGRANVFVRASPEDKPFVVTLCPLPSPAVRVSMFAGHPEPDYAAMAVVTGHESETTATSILREGWGLTPAEARLATALADGTSLKIYADKNQVSFHTARAHLARLRSKLDCRTQGDVIRRVLALTSHLLDEN